MINNKNRQKGITLIALVITIIVLLILAGISIAMLSGDNSILSKAGEARDITGTRDIEERIQIAYLGVLAEGNGNVEKGKLQTALENEFGAGKVTDLADDLSTVKIDGKEYQTGVTEGTSGGGGSNPTGLAGLTDAERELLQTGVSEIAYDDITNDNLKELDKIKAVITGEVPITTEMTYVTGTVDTGVVVSINGSEFVWVPVPVAISSDASTISTSGVNLATNQSTERPMAKLQSGSSTNYEGLLYSFSGTTSTYKPGYTVTDTSTHREPAYLSGSSYDDNTTYGGLFNSSDLQTEYNKVVSSINKYGGFYVGRYELGLEGTNPVSKPSSETVTTAAANNSNTNSWYGLYSKCKSYSADNLTSTMMWGSQYDAMMNWMAKTGKTVGTADSSKYNTATTTGSEEEDKINNVYDLYGCHYEWTLEADHTFNRVYRGGFYDYSGSPSFRFGYDPYYTLDRNGSRLSLYIK